MNSPTHVLKLKNEVVNELILDLKKIKIFDQHISDDEALVILLFFYLY